MRPTCTGWVRLSRSRQSRLTKGPQTEAAHSICSGANQQSTDQLDSEGSPQAEAWLSWLEDPMLVSHSIRSR